MRSGSRPERDEGVRRRTGHGIGADSVPGECEGLGEAIQVEAANVGPLQFGVSGRLLSLKAVPMLIEPIDAECTNCSGNAGMDLFGSAHRVTIDFGAMKLTVQ